MARYRPEDDRKENGQFRRSKMILEARQLAHAAMLVIDAFKAPMPEGDGEKSALRARRIDGLARLERETLATLDALKGKSRKLELERYSGFETFLSSRIREGKTSDHVLISDLYASYVNYAKGLGIYTETQRMLSQWLLAQDIVTGYRHLAKGRCFFGIVLLHPMDKIDLAQDFEPAAGLGEDTEGQEVREVSEPIAGGDNP